MEDIKNQQPPCPLCNGIGEIPSFKGVSRFVLSRDECPACGGTGLDLSILKTVQDSNGEDGSD